MPGPFRAQQISEHVFWVGAIDWRVRDFHGYKTARGTTYNAYLVVGDRIALIDTVKPPFMDEMLARVSSVIDPARIEIIVSNHSEMDHSGSLPAVAARVRAEKVLASTLGVKTLAEHFAIPCPVAPVGNGETLRFGNLTLTFAEARMLHWPESMFTYLAEDGVFFSQDAFGMHLASFERFADELPGAVLMEEAARYYANILLPFSPMVSKAVSGIAQTPFAGARLIAPDHGPIWRNDVWKIAEHYARWAEQRPSTKAVIIHDTMWNSTARMATAIAEGIHAAGARPRLLHLGTSDRSDAAAEILEAGALLVGSPTINNQIFPTVADTLAYLKGLKPKNLIGAAFGSFGWSGESVKIIAEALKDMKVELVGDGLRVKFVPTESDLEQCRELGSNIGRKLVEICVTSECETGR